MPTSEAPEPDSGDGPDGSRWSGSLRVAAGIFSSRIFGLAREMAAAAIFGASGYADAFAAAMKGPNLLQNLLGEQTLSASFIPVYSRMLAAGRREDAGRFAGAIFGLLLGLAAALGLVGVVFAAPIVALLTPGYLADAARVAAGAAEVDRYRLTVAAVRFIFPMTGFLVLSAWTLGVLNSHRRFFLPYFAPVVWNASIIAFLAGAALHGGGAAPGGASPFDPLGRIVLAACLGALIGGFLQFAVQLPLVLRSMRGFRISFSPRVGGVREALSAFGPLVAGRGAVQLSSYIDQALASLLLAGAMASLRWASVLYLLPIGLFAMSVSAAELPELARRTGASAEATVDRARQALRKISFLVVPTLVGYLAFGFLLVAAIFRRGSFGLADNWLVYLVLCGYSTGLLATTWSRLLQNVFYASGETATPARIAAARVAVSAVLGVGLMFPLDRLAVGGIFASAAGGRPLYLGAVGLALAAGVSSWVELALLRRALSKRLPAFALPVLPAARMALASAAAAVPAAGLWLALREAPAVVAAAVVVAGFAGVYLGLARLFRWPEAQTWIGNKRKEES